MLFGRIQDFNKMVRLVATVIRAPESPNRDRALAARLLVGISNKLNHRKHIAASELNILPIVSDTILSIGDEVILQMKQISENCTASDVEGLKRLLGVLLLLLEGPPEVSTLVIDKLCFIFNYLVNTCAENMDVTGKTTAVHKIHSVEENVRSPLMSVFADYAYKGLFAYVERLCAGYETTTTELLDKLNHLVSFVCQCNLFNCCTHVKYALLMHYVCNFGCQRAENGEKGEERCMKEILLCNSSMDRIHDTGCLENMLARNDHWVTYLVGKLASFHGAWFVSKSVFAHLGTKVQSDLFSCWLRCLSQFAHSENSFQEISLQAPASFFMGTAMVSSDSITKLISACDGLSSTEKLLGAAGTLKQTCFQRWFLALRMKVLAVIIDLFKVFDTVSFSQEDINISQQTEGASDSVYSREAVMCLLAGISSKMQRIAREYDLLNSSFMDIDEKSFRVVSSIALSCSLLAFFTGFAYFVPNSPLPEDLKGCTSKDSDSCVHIASINDIVGRLSYVEPETSMSFISILKGDAVHEASLQSQCRSRSFNSVYEAGNILRFCRTVVEEICLMKNETAGTNDDCLLPEVLNRRACFLVEVTKAWMRIPFRAPKFFFRVRPCVGAVLFSCNVDSNSLSHISVLSGSDLSLSLCLQLKNMPEELHIRIKRVLCILHCTDSLRRPHKNPPETTSPDYQSWTTDSMMRLHEKLRWHAMEQAGEELPINENDTHSSNGSVAETYVSFETNGGVQGFTSCLLDVSAFPCGSYKISWQCCCFDDRGSFWSLLPLSPGPEFTVRSSRS